MLNGAAFNGQTLDQHQAQSLTAQAQSLIARQGHSPGSTREAGRLVEPPGPLIQEFVSEARDLLRVSGRQSPARAGEREARVCGCGEGRRTRMTDGLEHALHLAVASLVDRQLDAASAEQASPSRARCCRPRARRPSCSCFSASSLGVAVDFGDIGLLDAVARDARAGVRARRRWSAGARRSCRRRAGRPGRRAGSTGRGRRRCGVLAGRSRW